MDKDLLDSMDTDNRESRTSPEREEDSITSTEKGKYSMSSIEKQSDAKTSRGRGKDFMTSGERGKKFMSSRGRGKNSMKYGESGKNSMTSRGRGKKSTTMSRGRGKNFMTRGRGRGIKYMTFKKKPMTSKDVITDSGAFKTFLSLCHKDYSFNYAEEYSQVSAEVIDTACWDRWQTMSKEEQLPFYIKNEPGFQASSSSSSLYDVDDIKHEWNIPKSGFRLFCKEIQKEVFEELPEASDVEIQKEIGRRWLVLDPEDQAIYCSQAELEIVETKSSQNLEQSSCKNKKKDDQLSPAIKTQRGGKKSKSSKYSDVMVDGELENIEVFKKISKKNMKTSSGNKIKKTNKIKKSLGIKRATSGYSLFIRSERLALTRADPSLSLGELCTQVGYRWSMLTESEKNVFRQRAEIVSKKLTKLESHNDTMLVPNTASCADSASHADSELCADPMVNADPQDESVSHADLVSHAELVSCVDSSSA